MLLCEGGYFPENALEQAELLGGTARRNEMLGGEPGHTGIEPELRASGLEPPSDHPGDRPRSGHALAELRVVILAAAHVADELEDMTFAVREVRQQPFPKDIAHFEREPQQDKARSLHPEGCGSVENAFDLAVIDGGNDR